MKDFWCDTPRVTFLSLAPLGERRFPILLYYGERRRMNIVGVLSIPWDMIAPQEAWAKLGPGEALAVLDGRPWRGGEPWFELEELNARVERWRPR